MKILTQLPPLPKENDIMDSARPNPMTVMLMAMRRSTKVAHLGGPGPTPAEVDGLIRIAARVPDHGKLAPWRFIVWEGDARKRAGDALADVLLQSDPGAAAERIAAERMRLMRAPVVIGVVSRAVDHPKIPRQEQVLSAGAACYSILLAAYASGYAGCWLTEWIAYDPAARAALGVLPDEEIAGMIYIGTARENAVERARVDPAKLITRA